MNKPSLTKYMSYVKKGGYLFVNSSLIDTKVERDDINVVYVDANDIAVANGNGRSANIVMFGAFVKYAQVTPYETAVGVLKHSFEKKPAVLESSRSTCSIHMESAPPETAASTLPFSGRRCSLRQKSRTVSARVILRGACPHTRRWCIPPATAVPRFLFRRGGFSA